MASRCCDGNNRLVMSNDVNTSITDYPPITAYLLLIIGCTDPRPKAVAGSGNGGAGRPRVRSVWPRVDPAVIMLTTAGAPGGLHGDEWCLLGRKPEWWVAQDSLQTMHPYFYPYSHYCSHL